VENLTRRREVLAQATNPGPLRLNPCVGTRNCVGTRDLDQSNTRTRAHACNKRDFEHKPRVSARSFFLLTNETPHCYEGTNGGCYSQLMTDQSQRVSGFQAPRRAQELSPEQRSLVELMHAYQFGSIENMPIREGQPILDSSLKVVGSRDLAAGMRLR
jgi:hypothetical protein